MVLTYIRQSWKHILQNGNNFLSMISKTIYRRHVTHGFTLIELMVSLAIFAIVGILLTEVFTSSIRMSARGEVSHTVKQNGDMVLNTLSRMIQNAKHIVSSCDGTAASSISLMNPDGGVSTIGCVKDGNALLRIASSSATTDYLTSTEVTLPGSACDAVELFICSQTANQSPSIKISFSLLPSNSTTEEMTQLTGTFETTVIVRNN